jgi:uncharacterized membrane protein YfcA
MKPASLVLFLIFGIGTLLDLIFSMLGMGVILQPSNLFTYAILVAASLAQVGIRLCSPFSTKRNRIYFRLQVMFYVCVVFDLAVMGVALLVYVLLQKPDPATESVIRQGVSDAPIGLKLMMLFLLLYLAISPLTISHLFKEYLEEQYDEELQASPKPASDLPKAATK